MLNNEISSGIYASACKSHGNDWSLSCLQPFKPQTKLNRFVIRIESFTWLQAAAIPPKISTCGIDSFFLPTLKIIEPKKKVKKQFMLFNLFLLIHFLMCLIAAIRNFHPE